MKNKGNVKKRIPGKGTMKAGEETREESGLSTSANKPGTGMVERERRKKSQVKNVEDKEKEGKRGLNTLKCLGTFSQG